MAERSVKAVHATLNRWVVKYAQLIAEQAQKLSIWLSIRDGWVRHI